MACVLPQLPIEIIQSEVLPRLPAKSIGRFRCVCKSWKSLLCSPGFAGAHLRYNTKYKLLLLDRPTQTFRTLDCEPVNHDSIITRPSPFKGDIMILASLDGLVCVALMNTLDLAFWNPLTRAYKKIRAKFIVDITCALAFYVDSSNDYKLLHMGCYIYGAFIYSHRLDSWRKIPYLENIMPSYIWWPPTLLGEKLYFMLESWRLELGPEHGLISFDVESEKFKKVQLPHFPNDSTLGIKVVALNDCIHLCVGYKDFKCDMWRMDGDEWIKVMAFDSTSYRQFRHIHIWRNGNCLAVLEDENSFKNIDLEDYFKDIDYFLPGRFNNERKGVIYMETLVSP